MKLCTTCGQEKNIPRGTQCAACIKKAQRSRPTLGRKIYKTNPKEFEPLKDIVDDATEVLEVEDFSDVPHTETRDFYLSKDVEKTLYPDTPADKAWWEKNQKMGISWPNWLEAPETHECSTKSCGKKFKTRLGMLRSCEAHV